VTNEPSASWQGARATNRGPNPGATATQSVRISPTAVGGDVVLPYLLNYFFARNALAYASSGRSVSATSESATSLA